MSAFPSSRGTGATDAEDESPAPPNSEGEKQSASIRVLVVDDDRAVREGLRDVLEHGGHEVMSVGDGKTALRRIREGDLDLILLDLKLPRAGGMEVLCEAQDAAPEVPIIIVSGKGSIADAVQAIKLGAYDYLEKPVDAQRTLVTVENALETARLRRERDRLLEEARDRYEMVGSSEPMQRVYDRIDKAARAQSSVLITGETGTGKERVARAIHHNSVRAGGPFVTVNCAAIPPDLIESELFGHEEGAFTGARGTHEGKFEQAVGGTLFLDEVADMSLKAQSKTLRALEEKEVQRVGGTGRIDVDVRLIAATNQDLETAMEKGEFREDLYYRLDVVSIEVPPLRARREDIPELACHFLESIGEERERPVPTLSAGALRELMRHDWPGNVRELRNVIEQLVVLTEAQEIGPAAVRDAIGEGGAEAAPEGLEEACEQFEKVYIRQALRQRDRRIQETADALGIDRSTLWRKMKRYGLEAQ